MSTNLPFLRWFPRIEWYILAYDDIDYKSIDMHIMFWTSIGFLIFYRVLTTVISCCVEYDHDDEENVNDNTQTQEYTLVKQQQYQVPPQISYDDRRNSISSSAKMFTSLKLKFDNTSSRIKRKIKRRNSWNNMIYRKRKIKKKKPDIVHKFLPIMLKLSILSAWCALSTVILGFGVWTVYPTLSSVIDSTINGICVY